MKKWPNFKVVGKVSDEDKQKVVGAINNLFEKPWAVPDREKIDHKKTAEQLSILKFINDETNALMRETGVEPFDFPADGYFVMERDNFVKFFNTESAVGVVDDLSPKIGLLYEDMIANIDFALIAYHETLHIKAMHVFEARKENDKTTIKCVRHGIIVSSSHEEDLKNNKYQYFSPLHEATVEWMSEQVFSKVLDLPELAKEKEYMHSAEFKLARRDLAKKLNINEKRIRYIRGDGTPSIFVYQYPRALLKYVCEKISARFNDRYPKKEDAFKEFIKVHFTSDLTTIIKLVDETFGEKSFRLFEKLNLDDKRTSSALVLMELEKKLQEMNLETNAN